MLRYIGVELDLITDIDMYQMVEKGIRGGSVKLVIDLLLQIIRRWTLTTRETKLKL